MATRHSIPSRHTPSSGTIVCEFLTRSSFTVHHFPLQTVLPISSLRSLRELAVLSFSFSLVLFSYLFAFFGAWRTCSRWKSVRLEKSNCVFLFFFYSCFFLRETLRRDKNSFRSKLIVSILQDSNITLFCAMSASRGNNDLDQAKNSKLYIIGSWLSESRHF